MKEEEKILVNYRLKRAKETFEDAKILFKNGRISSAVNRIYYAMFYAVNALLLTKGRSSAKHSGVLSLFQKDFVKTGLVPKELGKFYATMYEYRQKSDYRDFAEFQKEDVEIWLKKANDFLKEIKATIKKFLKEIS